MYNEKKEVSGHELFGNVIDHYSRAQMIEDGSLVDVSEVAKEAGFTYPIAVSSAVWNGYVVPSESDANRWGQDKEGRLWDTLWMLLVAIKSGNKGSRVDYQVLYRMKGRIRTIDLKALAGPGDHGEPVITIMLPTEE